MNAPALQAKGLAEGQTISNGIAYARSLPRFFSKCKGVCGENKAGK